MQTREMLFATRQEFREWLAQGQGDEGVWLVFGKKGGPKTLTAAQALEEALCFGWIDGQMKSVDDTKYLKYFSPRRDKSVWSEKNRKLVQRLEAEGLMTRAGKAKVEEARRNGTFEGPVRFRPTQEHVDQLSQALRGHEPAYTNYLGMTPSAKRAYAGGYFDAKSEEGRARKLAALIERLDLNLNPVESIAKAREARARDMA